MGGDGQMAGLPAGLALSALSICRPELYQTEDTTMTDTCLSTEKAIESTLRLASLVTGVSSWAPVLSCSQCPPFGRRPTRLPALSRSVPMGTARPLLP